MMKKTYRPANTIRFSANTIRLSTVTIRPLQNDLHLVAGGMPGSHYDSNCQPCWR